MLKSVSHKLLFFLLLGVLFGFATQTTQSVVVPPLTVPDSPIGSGKLIGYLTEDKIPDSIKFIPAPAALTNTAAQAADEFAYQHSLALRGTARWKLAAADANIHEYPKALATFSCAMGFVPSVTETPNLVMLIRRTKSDAILATKGAKDAYNRPRPFFVHKNSTCEPSDEKRLSTQGSYPSGHAATGWAWALILSELIPSRQNALLKRGYEFGQSRVVCGYHWQSDIDAGFLAGAAAVAALHADPIFNAQMETARVEVAKKLATNPSPPAECTGNF